MAHAPTPGLIGLHPDEQADAFTRWQAHVTAGRIGRRLPTDPQVAATRHANERIFLGKRAPR